MTRRRRAPAPPAAGLGGRHYHEKEESSATIYEKEESSTAGRRKKAVAGPAACPHGRRHARVAFQTQVYEDADGKYIHTYIIQRREKGEREGESARKCRDVAQEQALREPC